MDGDKRRNVERKTTAEMRRSASYRVEGLKGHGRTEKLINPASLIFD